METAPSKEARNTPTTIVDSTTSSPTLSSPNSPNNTTSATLTTETTTGMGAGSTIGVGDFVEASFASFEKTYGNTYSSHPPAAIVSSSSSDGNHNGHLDNEKNNNDSESDSSALSDPFSKSLPVIYQTILYSFLPFIFFCARRSMFGVASLLRSFLIGHALRVCVTFLTSFTSSPESSVTDPIKSASTLPLFIKNKVSSVLLRVTTTTCISIGVMNVNPDQHHGDRYHSLSSGSTAGNIGYNNNNNNGSLLNDWVQWCQVLIVEKLGGDPHSCPPPSLALLAMLTVLAFVVHPDGLTWVLLGKLRDLLYDFIRTSKICMIMIRDGHVPTLVISGIIAAILALAGVYHRASVQSPTNTKQSRKDRQSGNYQKGKKKRGGRRGGGGGGGNNSHHNTQDRRSNRNASRIKSESSKNSNSNTKIQYPHSDVIEKPQTDVNRITDHGNLNSNQDDNHVKTVEDPPSLVPVDNNTEIPGRKWTDPTPDDGSATSSLSTVLSFSSSGVPEISSPSNNIHSSEGTKKVVPSSNIASSEPSTTADFNPKKDQKKNKKPKKQPNITPGRGHRQKHPSTHSPKRNSTSRKSPVNPGVSSSTFSRPSSYAQTGSHLQESQKSSRIAYKQRKNYREMTSTPPSNAHNSASNSYFSSAPTTPVSSHQGPSGKVLTSSVIVSSQNGSSIQTNNGNSMFSSSFGGIIPTSNNNYNAASHHAHSDHFGHKAPGTRATATFNEANNMNIQYKVPTYSSHYNYSYNQIPKNPGKIELAGLLAQVGLIGHSCADLLRDVPDVEALSKFTNKHYEMYHVSKETQFQIQTLIEARKRRKEMASFSYVQSPIPNSAMAASNNTIRPPPGLGFGEISSPRTTASSSIENHEVYSNHFYHSGHASNASIDLPLLSRDSQVLGGPALQMNSNVHSTVDQNEEEEDEGIEADLLAQVGGQMAVSILDF